MNIFIKMFTDEKYTVLLVITIIFTLIMIMLYRQKPETFVGGYDADNSPTNFVDYMKKFTSSDVVEYNDIFKQSQNRNFMSDVI